MSEEIKSKMEEFSKYIRYPEDVRKIKSLELTGIYINELSETEIPKDYNCLLLQSEVINQLIEIKNIAESLVLTVETLEERIVKLESDHLGEKLNPEVWKFLTEKVDGLETEINIVRALGSRAFHSKKPNKCPVCEGTGKDKDKLVAEPYDQAIDQAIKILVNPPCHACEGKSIVWG